MKLVDHIYAIKNLVSQGPSSDDLGFSNKLIAHFLQVARALLTEQKADKYRYISEQSYQSLCVPLALGSFHNCCDGPTDLCKVLKSTIVIPKFLNTRWGAFIKVMDVSGEVIPAISLTQSNLQKYGRTKKFKAGWFLHDNHLYIINNTELVLVLLNGLFDKPSEISLLNCNTGNGGACASELDSEFPIDPDLIDPMYKMVLNYLLQSRQLPADKENDASDL